MFFIFKSIFNLPSVEFAYFLDDGQAQPAAGIVG